MPVSKSTTSPDCLLITKYEFKAMNVKEIFVPRRPWLVLNHVQNNNSSWLLKFFFYNQVSWKYNVSQSIVLMLSVQPWRIVSQNGLIKGGSSPCMPCMREQTAKQKSSRSCRTHDTNLYVQVEQVWPQGWIAKWTARVLLEETANSRS